MEKVAYNQFLKEFTEALPDGAFLTVSKGEKLNTMTIGWANIGHIWGQPILMVLVRKSRYTYRLIDDNTEFTVSIPFGDSMAQELEFCGSRSGRNYDKFKECDLSAIPASEVSTPLIEGCDLHYECKIKFKQDMNPEYLVKSYDQKWYPDKDYHTLYFGEIAACYREH